MKLGKKLIRTSIGALFLLSTLSLGVSFADTKQNSNGDVVQKINADSQIDWTKGFIKVTGSGAPPDKGNIAQKRLMALRAAKVDAFRQLLEVINGVHVSSETVVKDFVTESDVIKTKVEGIVKGAEQVGEPRYMSDGSVEVDLQLNIYGEKSVASVIMPEETKKIKEDDEPDTKLKPVTVSESYTSLIVDCKGLGVQPAMSPSIKDSDGGEVYVGNIPIDPDHVINEGIVLYTSTIPEARKIDRTGENPLIIKGKKVIGNFKADVVISNDDAKKVLGADGKTNFLKEFKVIFLI